MFVVNCHEVTGGTKNKWTFDGAAMCGEFDFAAMCSEFDFAARPQAVSSKDKITFERAH